MVDVVVSPGRWRPLREHRDRVDALGGERAVGDGRDLGVAEWPGRGLAEPGLLEGLLELIDVVEQLDHPTVDLGVEIGIGGERGQAVDREVDLHGAAAGLPVLDVVQEARRQVDAVELLEEVIRGWMAVITVGAWISSPPSSTTPRTAPGREDPRDRRVHAHLGAEEPRRLLAGLRDGAHAAFHEAPRRDLAVADVADRVVHGT